MNIDEILNEKINIDDRFIEAHNINGLDTHTHIHSHTMRERQEGPEGRVFVEKELKTVRKWSNIYSLFLSLSLTLSLQHE